MNVYNQRDHTLVFGNVCVQTCLRPTCNMKNVEIINKNLKRGALIIKCFTSTVCIFLNYCAFIIL